MPSLYLWREGKDQLPKTSIIPGCFRCEGINDARCISLIRDASIGLCFFHDICPRSGFALYGLCQCGQEGHQSFDAGHLPGRLPGAATERTKTANSWHNIMLLTAFAAAPCAPAAAPARRHRKLPARGGCGGGPGRRAAPAWRIRQTRPGPGWPTFCRRTLVCENRGSWNDSSTRN